MHHPVLTAAAEEVCLSARVLSTETSACDRKSIFMNVLYRPAGWQKKKCSKTCRELTWTLNGLGWICLLCIHSAICFVRSASFLVPPKKKKRKERILTKPSYIWHIYKEEACAFSCIWMISTHFNLELMSDSHSVPPAPLWPCWIWAAPVWAAALSLPAQTFSAARHPG